MLENTKEALEMKHSLEALQDSVLRASSRSRKRRKNEKYKVFFSDGGFVN
jgi:hypothetical protein